MSNLRPFEQYVPDIDDSAWVDPSAVVIGQVHLAAHSSIWPNVTVRGDINRIVIGQYTNIQDASVLHISHDSRFMPGGAALEIGNEVTVGHQVMLHGCRIGNRCLIGMSSLIMDHAVLGDEVMVGAGSLVPGGKELESGYLYVGRPVKKVRLLTDSEKEYLAYSASHYARLAERHRASLEFSDK
jgi:carbonic anhydrase/acetyltransferase-like protein (isoleucine patch superfamily)